MSKKALLLFLFLFFTSLGYAEIKTFSFDKNYTGGNYKEEGTEIIMIDDFTIRNVGYNGTSQSLGNTGVSTNDEIGGFEMLYNELYVNKFYIKVTDATGTTIHNDKEIYINGYLLGELVFRHKLDHTLFNTNDALNNGYSLIDWTADTDLALNKLLIDKFVVENPDHDVLISIDNLEYDKRTISQEVFPVMRMVELTNFQFTSVDASSKFITYEAIDERGFVYSDSDSTPTNDEVGSISVRSFGGGIYDVFTREIPNLQENTTYYIRAYVSSASGKSYSYPVSIQTGSSPIIGFSSNGVPIINNVPAVSTTNNTDFGSLLVTTSKAPLFNVANTGGEDYNITNSPTPIQLENPSTVFSITGVPNPLTTIASNTNFDFTIQATTSTPGIYRNNVQLVNDGNVDYTFPIKAIFYDKPEFLSSPALSIELDGTTVTSTIAPNFDSTTVVIEYGLTNALGESKTYPTKIFSENNASIFSLKLDLLQPGATHYFKINLTNSAGTTSSLIYTYESIILPPVIDVNTGISILEGATHIFSQAEFSVSDPNFQTPVITVASVPQHGALYKENTILSIGNTFLQDDINTGKITYVHDGTETSSDSFTLSVKNSLHTLLPETVNISITNSNDPPIAIQQTRIGEKSIPVTFTTNHFTDNTFDEEGDPLTKIKITSLPTAGSLTLNSNPIIIGQEIPLSGTANIEYVVGTEGTYNFTWKAFTNTYSTDSAAVILEISKDLTPPVITDWTFTINEDELTVIPETKWTDNYTDTEPLAKIALISSDPGISFVLGSVPLTLPAEIAANQLSNLKCISAENFNGIATARWDASDGTSYTDGDKLITFTVTAVDDAPTSEGFTITGTEDTDLPLVEADFTTRYADAENDPFISIRIDPSKTHGLLKVDGSTVTTSPIIVADISKIVYTPVLNSFGNKVDSIYYKVINANAESTDWYVIYIDLNGENDSPSNQNLSFTMREDDDYRFASLMFSQHYSDPENDAQESIKIVSLPSKGTLRLDGIDVTVGQEILISQISNLTFTPIANEYGTNYTTFEYQSKDGAAFSPTYTVTANVTSVTDPMVLGFHNALTFTGNGYVDIKNLNDFPNTNFTFEMMVKPINQNIHQVIASTLDNNMGWEIGIDDQNHWYITYGDVLTTHTQTFSEVNPFGKWYKIVLVGGATPSISIIENTTTELKIPLIHTLAINSNTEIVLGKNRGPGNDYFTGVVDEVYIWSKIRTLAESLDIFKIISSNEPDLYAYWDCNDIESIKFKDEIGTHNGMIQGGLYYESTGQVIFDVTDEEVPLTTKMKYTDWDNLESQVDIVSTTGGTTIFTTSTTDDRNAILYTPETNFNGIAEIIYQLASNNAIRAYHYIDVKNIDDKPVVVPQTIYKGQDPYIDIESHRFIDNFSDPDNDPLHKVIIKTLPSNGLLSHNGSNLVLGQEIDIADIITEPIRYTPDAQFTGTDSFTWNCIANGQSADTDATITLVVSTPQDPIIISDATVSIQEDQTLTISKNFLSSMISDDTNANTIAFITSPTHGYISQGGNPVNTPLEIDYATLDSENIVLHFDENWYGQDSIRWDIKDNNGYTDGDATLTIDVAPVNDLPVISDISIDMLEDTEQIFRTTIFKTNYTDIEGDPATIVNINTLPQHGSLYYNNAIVQTSQLPLSIPINTQELLKYIPTLHYFGNDTIKYQVKDAPLGISNEACLVITIIDVEEPPLNQDFTVSTNEDTNYTFTNANFTDNYSDPENKALNNVIIKTVPLLGSLYFNNVEITSNVLPYIIPIGSIGDLVFVPGTNENGTPYTSFEYSVTDTDDLESLNYTVTVNVNGVDDVPEISGNIQITLDEDHKYYFTDHIFKDVFVDYEHYGLKSVKVIAIANNVTLEYNNIQVTAGTEIPIANITQLCYTPNANENGNGKQLFTFTLIDSQDTETSNAGNCIADIIPVNDPPIITDSGLWNVTEGTLFTHPLEVTNPDQDQLTYAIISGPVGMTISNTGVITWQADVETNLVDGIVVRISDGVYNVDLNAQITITNVNNKVPVVTTESITLQLKNLDSATKPILTATDEDFGTTTFQDWTIVSQTDYDNNGQDPFSIDPQTGELSYNDLDELYIENNPGYTIQVTVSDGVNTSVPKSITVTLIDNRLTQTVSDPFVAATDYELPTTTQPVKSDAELVLNYTSSDTNVATVNGNILNILSVGTTQIEVTQDGNYTYKPFSQTFIFTVYKAPITVTANSETRIYGVSNPTFTYQVTGARVGDTNLFTTEPTLTTTATETSSVGTYPITITGGASDKYDITYHDGTLNITKAEWNATWTNYKPEIYINETIDIQISEQATYTVSSDNVIAITVQNHEIKGSYIGASDITISIEADINHNAQDIVKTVTVVNEKPIVTSSSVDIYLKLLEPTDRVQLTAEDNDNPQSVLNQWELRHVQDKDNNGIAAFTIDPGTGELVILDYDELMCCNADHVYNFEVRVSDGIEYSNWTNLQVNIYDNREEQTVSGIFIQNAIYTDLGFNQPENSDQGIALIYESADNLIAKPFGNYLGVNGIGSTTIEAKAAGNNMYKPYEVTFTFTVAKAPITVTAENKTRGFEEPEPTFTYVVSGARAGDTDIYTVEPTLTTDATMYSPTGDYNILISGGASDKYIPNYVNGTLTITKAEWNVVWTNQQTEFNINETLLVILSRPVTFTLSSDNTNVMSTQGATLTAEGIGSAKITISIEGDINHNPQVIEVDIQVVNQKPVVTSSSFDIYLKGLLPTDNIQFTATDVDGSNFEGWEARYIQDKDNNGILPATMDAATGILNITDYDELFKFGDHTYNFQVRVSDGISYSDWKDIQINIYDDRDLQSITANYIESAIFTDLEVMQPENSDQNLPLTYHSSDENIVSVNGNTFVINRVGSSIITVEHPGNNEYLPYSHNFTFTVIKAPITVTADSKTRVYGEMNPTFTYSVTGQRSGDTNIFTVEPNMSTTATETSDVGEYAITISGGMSDNYIPSYINGSLNITKATWADVIWINEQDEFFTNESLTVLLSEDVDFTLSSDNSNVITTQDETITAVNSGTATLTIMIAGDTNHDPYQIVKQINVVTQKPVVLTSVSDIYLKGLLPSYTILLKAEDPDSPLSALTDWEIRNVEDKDNNGTEAFTVNSNTGELAINDYDELFMYGDHIYNIEARVSDGVNYSDWKSIQIYIYDNRLTQSFTSDFIDEALFTDLHVDQPETTDQGLELTYTSSDTQVVDTNGNTLNINGAGTTVITVTQEGDNQYKPFQVTFTITIEKAPITVTADEATRVYGIANPNFTYSVTGARDGDNQIFTVEPTFNTPATETSDVGEYDLTISGGASDNYIPTYVNCTMTITKAHWNIVWVNETLEYEVGETLTVQLSKDVDFIVTTSETDIVYPDGHTIEAITLGESYIAIYIPEDKNHFLQIIHRLLVVKDFTSIGDDEIKVKLYPNPAKDYVYISGLQSNDLVQIISINGRTVREMRSTDSLLRIATEGLANGLYLIQINHEKVYKLVISK